MHCSHNSPSTWCPPKIVLLSSASVLGILQCDSDCGSETQHSLCCVVRLPPFSLCCSFHPSHCVPASWTIRPPAHQEPMSLLQTLPKASMSHQESTRVIYLQSWPNWRQHRFFLALWAMWMPQPVVEFARARAILAISVLLRLPLLVVCESTLIERISRRGK